MPFEAYVLDAGPRRCSVYFSERGLRTAEAVFHSEDDACRHLLDLLLRDPTTRRRA